MTSQKFHSRCVLAPPIRDPNLVKTGQGFWPKKTVFPIAANGSIIIYYTVFTILMRKGLDICPLPTDVRDSCFRRGAGAQGGKPHAA